MGSSSDISRNNSRLSYISGGTLVLETIGSSDDTGRFDSEIGLEIPSNKVIFNKQDSLFNRSLSNKTSLS